FWLDTLLAQVGDKRLMRGGEGYVDASVGIPLLEIRGQSVVNEGGHAHGVANPHYWLDPANAIIVTAGIVEALARIAPAERDFVEPKPGVAPSPAHLAHLIAEGRKVGVRAVVHEPYEPEDASRLLAGKLGIPFVRLATSVGSVPHTQDYLALLDFNVTALVRA